MGRRLLPSSPTQQTAAERLDGFALRNQETLESLAGIMKLRDGIVIETTGSMKELTTLHNRGCPD